MKRLHCTRAELEAEVSALRRLNAGLVAAETRSASTIRVFSSLERVNHVIAGAGSMDELLSGVLGEMLELFACDRAWLLFPCDPHAPSWRVPMERTRAEWPGAFALGVEVPMDATAAAVLAAALETDGPVVYDVGSNRPPPADAAEAFGIRTQMTMALRPKVGAPWLLGIHHCERAHDFSIEKQLTFSGIGRRMGDALGTFLVARDLEASARRFRTLVENAPEAIVVADPDGRIVDANPNASRLFGLEREGLLGRALHELGAEASDTLQLSRMLARAVAGDSAQLEWTCRAAGGQTRTCDARIVLLDPTAELRVRVSILDISERVAMQKQLLHLQKMEAVGELAGGVAHDFNNQLAVILCYADLLALLPDLPPRAGEYAGRIVETAEEAAALTRQLLAFSRRSVLQARAVDLNEVISSLGVMLERVVGRRIELRLALGDGPVLAKVDRQQLEQLVVNLVNNARDAMPRGGHLVIATELCELGRMPGPGGDALGPGTYAALRVVDDGVGMDAVTRARIFEPFFTTKERGSGTGLGLSTAYGVVRQSGGTILVDTEPGVGTTFTVLLPVATGGPCPDEQAAPVAAARGGHEAILVVEDRVSVADVTAHVLADAGYRVTVARHPQEALEQEARGEPIDMLLTDVNLPGLDGVELAEQLERRRPGLRVLFCSGYSARAMALLSRRSPPVEFLQKPYRVDTLLGRVRAVLDAASPRTP